MEDESIFASNEQNKRILNIDERALAMDGTMQNKGDHPTVTFYNESLPVLGTVASKTSQSTMIISGSIDLGGVIPPHFQCLTATKSTDCEKRGLKLFIL